MLLVISHFAVGNLFETSIVQWVKYTKLMRLSNDLLSGYITSHDWIDYRHRKVSQLFNFDSMPLFACKHSNVNTASIDHH